MNKVLYLLSFVFLGIWLLSIAVIDNSQVEHELVLKAYASEERSAKNIYIGNSMLGSRIKPDTWTNEIVEEPNSHMFYQVNGMSGAGMMVITKSYLEKLTGLTNYYYFFIDQELTCVDVSDLQQNNSLIVHSETTDISEHRELFDIINSTLNTKDVVTQKLLVNRSSAVQGFFINRLEQNIKAVYRLPIEQHTFISEGIGNNLNDSFEGNTISAVNQNCNYNFDFTTPSYVDGILKLHKDYDTKPYFIRVKPRPNVDGGVDLSHDAERYFENVKKHVESNEGYYIDLTEVDPAEYWMYSDSTHISPDYDHTEEMYKMLKEYIK